MEGLYTERRFKVFIKLSKTLGKSNNNLSREYYNLNSRELIGTLLGSCVAVCLYDEKNKIGAMNHFMLPGRTTRDKNSFDEYTSMALPL
jgi:chemotaxis receptor (MCP) glutamine deamidase CheD